MVLFSLILSKCFPQKQLIELTGTLEEERVRARRLQNERDVQQATAMSHKERERHIHSELENEKKKRAQVEQKLENEREKNASQNRALTEKDSKIDELQRDLEAQVLRQSDKVRVTTPMALYPIKSLIRVLQIAFKSSF